MIVGAGLAGLITAHLFPHEPIVEAKPKPTEVHRALLRFRSPAVGELVGFPFREVTVHKGIWYCEEWQQPNIRVANLYSEKVTGGFGDRSIWDIRPVQRWIAPEDLYDRLVNALAPRITWGREVDFSDPSQNYISTAPMPVVLKALGTDAPQFKRAAITVHRYRITKPCDVYQTVYFPSLRHTLYRASITGDLLICEFAGEPQGQWGDEIMSAFHLNLHRECKELGKVEQNWGKIVPIEEGLRRWTIAHLTREYNIFSIGRFATWRNILLDDVVHDAAVVKRLIIAGEYDRKLAAIGGKE